MREYRELRPYSKQQIYPLKIFRKKPALKIFTILLVFLLPQWVLRLGVFALSI